MLVDAAAAAEDVRLAVPNLSFGLELKDETVVLLHLEEFTSQLRGIRILLYIFVNCFSDVMSNRARDYVY